MDLLLDYLDTAENSNRFLPAMLSESISKFYYLKNPRKKKEILEATRVLNDDTYVNKIDLSSFKNSIMTVYLLSFS